MWEPIVHEVESYGVAGEWRAKCTARCGWRAGPYQMRAEARLAGELHLDDVRRGEA